jgi:hypothetical protein
MNIYLKCKPQVYNSRQINPVKNKNQEKPDYPYDFYTFLSFKKRSLSNRLPGKKYLIHKTMEHTKQSENNEVIPYCDDTRFSC